MTVIGFAALCALIYTLATVKVTVHSAELASVLESKDIKFKNIYTLDGYCKKGKCNGFRFENPDEVAFFDLQAKVRIMDSSTYDIINPVDHNSVVFGNSTFAHFPMHLFYALDVQELDMRNCSMKLLTWENFLMAGNLQILLLTHNKIERIEEYTFEYAGELQYLFLDENRISELYQTSFAGLTKLRYLDLSDNRLEQLPQNIFENLTSLQELNLADNFLRVIDDHMLATNPQLLTLSFARNDLRDLSEDALRTQTNLVLLDISHNSHLKEFIASIQVRNLIAANCSLDRVNIYGSANNVDMRDNRILELYFSQPETLENLNLRNNSLQQIASLTLASNLRSLDLSDNPELRSLPDPWMTKSLERLNLSNTGLKELPLSSLLPQSNLRSLDVSHNKIKQINPINLRHLTTLTHFYIHANDWNCYNLKPLMDLLILASGLSYIPDAYDADFPGEYIHDIACMYRLDEEDNAAEQRSDSSEHANDDDSDSEQTQQQRNQLAEQLSADPLTEIRALRRELQTIVKFYEQKMDKAFNMIDDLNERLQAFERMNASMWQKVTITI